MAHLHRKTLEGKGHVNLRVVTILARLQGSAGSRPRLAARCCPACRSSTSSRCSSCRCCTRNSFSLSCITGTVGLRTGVGVGGIWGLRGSQKDQYKVLMALSRTLTQKKLRARRPEVPLLPNSSLLHFHHSRTPPNPSRFLLSQSPSRPSLQKAMVHQIPKMSPTKIHLQQKTNLYPYRSSSSFGTSNIFRICKN